MTIQEVLNQGISVLEKNYIRDAKIDAYLLLEYILDVKKIYLLINGHQLIDESSKQKYFDYINIRARGKPVQYIIGNQEFMGLTFKVDENVLIPRQDTEMLVEKAIECIDKNSLTSIMDLGTGSGCIPVSLCHYCDNITACAVDISKEALRIAQLNANINAVNNRIDFIESNLFENIDSKYENNVDLIISNPPYIPKEAINNLMVEVKDYEPLGALDGGNDGLDFYRKISKQAVRYLKPRGYILFEVGHNQSNDVKQILENHEFINIKIIKDLSGINRVVYGEKVRNS